MYILPPTYFSFSNFKVALGLISKNITVSSALKTFSSHIEDVFSYEKMSAFQQCLQAWTFCLMTLSPWRCALELSSNNTNNTIPFFPNPVVSNSFVNFLRLPTYLSKAYWTMFLSAFNPTLELLKFFSILLINSIHAKWSALTFTSGPLIGTLRLLFYWVNHSLAMIHSGHCRLVSFSLYVCCSVLALILPLLYHMHLMDE